MHYLHRVSVGPYTDYEVSDSHDPGDGRTLVWCGSKELMLEVKQDLSILCGMEHACMDAYYAGKYRPLQDIIDELRIPKRPSRSVVNNEGVICTVSQAAESVGCTLFQVWCACNQKGLAGGLGWKFVDDWDGEPWEIVC